MNPFFNKPKDKPLTLHEKCFQSAFTNPCLFLHFSLKSFKQRLQDRTELTIDLELAAMDVRAGDPAPSEPVDDGSQPGLPRSNPDGVVTSESNTAVLSAALLDHVAMEEDPGKPGAHIATDTAVGPEANQDTEKVMEDEGLTQTAAANVTSDVGNENTACVVSSPAPPATELKPKEIFVEPPQINEDIVRALKVVVQLHRVNQDVMMQSMKDAVRPGFKCQKIDL